MKTANHLIAVYVKLARFCLPLSAATVLIMGMPASVLSQTPKKEPADSPRMETRTYSVDSSLVTGLAFPSGWAEPSRPEPQSPPTPFAEIEPSRLVAIFTTLGVAFPEGSRVVWLAALNRLVVSNTPQNLDVFEKVLDDIMPPNNVTIEWRIVRMPRAVAKNLFKEEGGIARTFKISEATLNRISELEDQKKVFVINQAKLATTLGQPATVKSVREFIYPASFREPQVIHSGVSAVTPANPAQFATREVGELLTVTPVLGADGKTIDLQLNPERSILLGMKKWEIQVGSAKAIVAQQPDFATRSVITNVSLRSGTTVLLAVYDRIGEEQEGVDDIELMFLTATASKK